MKTLACRDVGYSCDYVARGETEEEVMQKGVEYGRKEHGLKQEDMTPELKQKIRGLSRTS
jgi:predicted small metal-binding protein